MAGSRLERIGSIFSRTTGLIRSNVLKYDDRPVWYDVYRVFPPTLEPHFARQPIIPEGASEEVPNIFYSEDTPRALFYSKFGNNPGSVSRNLINLSSNDPARNFIERYQQTESEHTDWKSTEIVEAIASEFYFHRTSRSSSSSRPLSVETGKEIPIILNPQGEDHLEDVESRPKRKNLVITADTLLGMFKEAKDKSKDE